MWVYCGVLNFYVYIIVIFLIWVVKILLCRYSLFICLVVNNEKIYILILIIGSFCRGVLDKVLEENDIKCWEKFR